MINILTEIPQIYVRRSGVWNTDKGDVTIEKSGEIFVKSKEKTEFVKLIWKCDKDISGKVLGDAYERSYADLEWKEIDKSGNMPWYFALDNGKKVYLFGVKTLANAMCFFKCSKNEITLFLDIRCGGEGVDLKGRILKAATLCYMESEKNAFDALGDFCALMCENPRYIKTPVFGGNDWYCNYGENSYEKIILHAKRVVECTPKNAPKPYMVIDDGWQICSKNANVLDTQGPWKYANSKFKDMKKLAQEITNLGAIPGLWYRPLKTSEYVPDDAYIHYISKSVALDPSHPYCKKMIEEDAKTIASWGYKLIKFDFSTYDMFGEYGKDFDDTITPDGWHFYDTSKTSCEIVKDFYNLVRNSVGEDVVLIGCNTIGHLSAGIVDMHRIGDDTSGYDWQRVVGYGVNTLAFRLCQNKTFFTADADCVGIMGKIDWQKNQKWLDLLSKSSTALFVSIHDDAYTDEVKNDIKNAFEECVNSFGKKLIPLDWKENKIPQKWQWGDKVIEYRWH